MIRTERRGAVVIVTIDNPPVNALPVAGWFALADAIRSAGRDDDTHAVIVAAAGRGFQAGVDIKELAADPTHRSLIGVNRGCAETFAAVYDCPVPVIAAVNGFCLGGVCPRSTGARSAPRRISRGSCRSTRCARCSSPARW
jgi:enoyl-CoA hydratase/carnithine racemase